MNPVHDVQDLGIRIRLRILVGIAAVGLLLFAAMAFETIAEIHKGETRLAENRLASNVARDFVNPSQSLIGAESFFHRVRIAHDRADMERAKASLEQSRAKLEAGHQYYVKTMYPGHLRDLVTVDAYQSAEQWYNLAEGEYLPLVEREGWQKGEGFRAARMDGLVARNLAISDEIGRLADLRIISHEQFQVALVRSRSWILAAAGLVLLLIQLLLGAVIDARVGLSTQRLQETLVELRRKNTEVEGFVYIVSHDLRAPLVNVQGFARELEESCTKLRKLLEARPELEQCWPGIKPILDEEIVGALHYISASTAKFERLIGALIGFARQGRQVYQMARVNVWELATNAVATFRQQIIEAGAEVTVGNLPAVTADATALGQVFSNLIGNCLKYRSPKRPLSVEVGGQMEGGMTHYWVKDNGLGIPDSSKDRLFQVFQRFHTQLAQGEGMGLAIAHRIVERHGGTIWVESQEDAGSTFHFYLPGNTGSKPSNSQESANHERV